MFEVSINILVDHDHQAQRSRDFLTVEMVVHSESIDIKEVIYVFA